MNYHYWKVHNHANIQLICIQIYIIASNSITKQKQKKEKKTLLWMKSCIVFIGFFQRIASLIYSKIEMHKDKIVDKN